MTDQRRLRATTSIWRRAGIALLAVMAFGAATAPMAAAADTLPPDLTVPPDIVLEAPADTSPSNTGIASAIDDTDPNPTITWTDQLIPGFCAANFTIARTWEATDDSFNSSTGTQLIEVADTTPPSIVAPSDVVLQPGDTTDPSATGSAVAPDASQVSITFSDQLVGNTIQRTWTATDQCGNQASATQNITILDVQLALTISTDDTAPLPGETIVYRLSADNNGTSDAVAVVFTETVPAHTTFNESQSSPFWSCDDGDPAGTQCTLDFGALAAITPGGAGNVTFAVDVDPGTGGLDIVNNASVIDNASGATSSDQLTVTVVNPDTDGDGVLDTVDECTGTSLATDAPDSPKKNRFFVDANGNFVDGNGTASGYTIADTRGCSSKQIIEAADLGRGHTRFGLSRSALEAWIF